MPEKPSQNEDEYFARQDAELLRKERLEQERAARAAERKTHQMRCPKCGGHLKMQEHEGVQIDQCPDCGGLWLDAGELEQLVKSQDPGVVGRFFGGLFSARRKK
jgi:hypothetical protein